MALKKSPIKPWHRMGISRRQYLSGKPWKKNGMTRASFENVIMDMPQETIDEMKRHAEANLMLEAMFGKDTVDELD